MIRRLAALPVLALTAPSGPAQDSAFWPGAVYDDAVPTLQAVVGHDFGERITSHAETERYLRALAESTPRASLVRYGTSWEGRALYYLVVGSTANMKRADFVRSEMRRLALGTAGGDAARVIAELPAVVWLAYSVHGNEISPTDAALLTAYHLLAAEDDRLVRTVTENALVIIDPLQNPDGRDRFVHHFRSTRGRWPDADPAAGEHDEPWPGGRTNHYWFDMNRDWIALTQKETRARVRAFLDWYPLVYADIHEMGSNSTYYFPPPARPYNPQLTEGQLAWLTEFGKNNARHFDRMKIDYFTREIFDAFYPGYGVSWPTLHGAIGMTYEQGSVRGLVVDRDDGTQLTYRQSIKHHFVASLATAQTAARGRKRLLQSFHDFRQSAVREAGEQDVRAYALRAGRDPGRAAELVALLMAQGVRVHRVTSRVVSDGVDLAAGTYVVSLQQTAGRLARCLLAREQPMKREFVAEQQRRRAKRLRAQIYDVTAWSLPLLFGVECVPLKSTPTATPELSEAPRPEGRLGDPAQLAYVIDWNDAGSRALAGLLRRGVRVHSGADASRLAGRDFGRGALIVKVRDNPADLHDRMAAVVRESGAEVLSTDTAWTKSGSNFGSRKVRLLAKPRVALAFRRPASAYSAGFARWVLERDLGYPVTMLAASRLATADLAKYDVLVLPSARGSYAEAAVEPIRAWVRSGGTLVAIGSATGWLAAERVGLLPTKPRRGDERPPSVPGAILRARLDGDHWLTAGYGAHAHALVRSRNAFEPLAPGKGTNVAVYEKDMPASGFVWQESTELLAGAALLMHRALGRGHVIGFAEDPNYRGLTRDMKLLFANAIFRGPAH